MPKAIEIGRKLIVLIIIILLMDAGCATANKGGKTIMKRSQASKVNASQLGRNKYYFTTKYQKKISKSHKR